MGQKIPRESFKVADKSQQKEIPRPPPGLPTPSLPLEEDASPFPCLRTGCLVLPSIQIYLSVIAESSEHFSISSFSICGTNRKSLFNSRSIA